MALEIKSWLTELGFKEDQIASLAPVLGERVSEIEKAVLRQSDYSREMNKLTQMTNDLNTKNEQLNADIAEFATLSASEQTEATELRNQIEKAQREAFTLSQKITRYATENGIDVKKVLGEVEPVPEPKAPAAFDDKKLRSEFQGVIGGVANYLLDLTAHVDDIAREHQELTGERFDRRGFVAAIKADIAANKTDNLDPVKRWEKQYGIAEKRTAAATAKREAEIKTAREEGRQAAMSEMHLPGGAVPQGGEHNSPVFKTTNVSKGSVLQRPQPSQRMNSAVSALATGKYRKTA